MERIKILLSKKKVPMYKTFFYGHTIVLYNLISRQLLMTKILICHYVLYLFRTNCRSKSY